MNGKTPAREIKPGDLAKNVEAFQTCLVSMLALNFQPRLAVDIRYGLGGWATKLVAAVPEVRVVGFEADRATYEAAARLPQVEIHNEEYRGQKVEGCGLLLADFNTLTLLKARELDEALAALQPEFIILTDVACGKLHLNYRSYGLKRPDLDDYYQEFGKRRLAGFTLVAWARKHHAASTSVWSRRV